MNVLLPIVLILTAQPTTASDDARAQSVEVFSCHFERASDSDYDDWPDGWTRRRSRDYPHYLKAIIAEGTGKPSPSGKNCLRMELDGGAVAIKSPPISISHLFNYILQGQIKTEGLKHDVAYYSVAFYDKDRKLLKTYYSDHFRNIADWKAIEIGPLTPEHEEARIAIIGLHLRPTHEADLTGSASFDEIRLLRLPRMTLSADSPHNVFFEPKNMKISCRVSGVLERTPQLKLELFDVNGQLLDKTELRLDGKSIQRWHRERGYDESQISGSVGKRHSGYYDTVTWNPKFDQYGFFRILATMNGGPNVTMQQEMTLAIIHRQGRPTGREFGWSLPHGEDPLPLKPLASLLTQVGINWIKFPVWFGKNDGEWAERLAAFAERIGGQGIEMVGVLDQPPEESRGKFGNAGKMQVADIFVEKGLWRPVVEPVMTRLPLKVKWWQLGSDNDTSFVGLPDLETKIREIKKNLELFGQEIHLGLSWQWLYQAPNSESPPWDFLSNTVDPPFTQGELESYLEGNRLKGAKLWLMLKPLSKEKYSTETRVHDLITRMLATKIKRADAVFIPDPFNNEYGLMNEDGTPGELLLPWRTTALMLSGKEYIGSITLPGGSINHIFSQGGQVLMVVWNDNPTSETIYLGDHLKQIDVWGRETIPVKKEHRHVIEAGPLPIFITGVNLPIVQWRMQFSFDKRKLASIFGREQDASLHFKNTFSQGVGGSIFLHTPEVWKTTPQKIRFKLATGQDLSRSFQVELSPDASTGQQPIQIDFDFTADRKYKFSIYRSMQVGLGDVEVYMTTQLGPNGELIVKQHLSNHTNRFVSFSCMLYAPDRRRQRVVVTNLGRGRNTETYIFPKGEELIGKVLWLRVEEINGPRIMNYRIKVEP